MSSITIRAAFAEARRTLADTLNLPANEAAIEADILLRTSLGEVTRAWRIVHEDDQLPLEHAATFNSLLQRRLNGEPVAYILGYREFYGHRFRVTPAVLIPRPDTETLVNAALEHIPDNAACSILDLGTGSGAIAISLALERPLAAVTAVDVSIDACAVARENARLLGAGNMQCLQSNWFEHLIDRQFHVIASNPPYIPSADPHLRQGDLRFEPTNALVAGEDGLRDILKIVSQAGSHLIPGGWLLLEHGFDQAPAVQEIMREAGYTDMYFTPDLAGHLRVTAGRKD